MNYYLFCYRIVLIRFITKNSDEPITNVRNNYYVNKPSYFNRRQFFDEVREAPFNVASQLLLVYINDTHTYVNTRMHTIIK